MAEISRLNRFVAGAVRGVDLASNTLVVSDIKVGGGAGTILTKTILDRLISLQDGSDIAATYHHHDGLYFTETELGSNANGAGASLIGIEDANTQFTSTNVEGALDEALDAAQAAQADADANTSDIADLRTTQGTSDGDTNLGTFTGATISDNGSVKSALQELETAHEEVDQNVNDLITLSGVSENATSLGTFTGSIIPDSSTVKASLQALETYEETTRGLVNGLEWQESALDYVVDNTAVPASEVSGDRYVLSHDGGAPHANYDGASAGDIVEFNGSVWVATTPTTGMFISVDDETTLLYYWGGAAWATKSFEATTASTGLTKVGFDIQLSSGAAGDGLGFAAGVLSVNVDDSTVEINADTLRVKDLGISSSKLAATSVTAAKLGNDVAGTGLTGGNGSAISVDFSSAYNDTKAVSAADLSATTTGKGASIIGIEDSGALITATTVEGALAELATSISSLTNDSITESMVAGEAMSANTLLAVRMAKGAETAGRVYLADKDASAADDFHVIGLIYAGSAVSAADPVTVYKFGKFDLGAAHGLTIGEEHFLGAAGVIIDGGASGANAPSTADDAVVSVCIARTTNIVEVSIDRRGVN